METQVPNAVLWFMGAVYIAAIAAMVYVARPIRNKR